MGLQGGIYQGCGPPWTVMAVQCECKTTPFTLSSNNFVVGEIYYIVMDGCGGNICDYSIAVTQGSTVQQPPDNPGAISGPLTVCQNSATSYNIAPPTGATIYTWTLDPPLGTVSGSPNNNVTINWGGTPGTTELCVEVANQCLQNSTPSCTTIVVQPVPTATISGEGTLCTSSGSPSGTVDLTVTFTGDSPWNFTYAINGVAQPPIQTSDNPYILSINQLGTVTLTSVSSVNGNCPGTVSGSATITEIKLTPTYTSVSATCNQSNGSIDLTPAGGQSPYIFIWSNGETTEDLHDVAPGSYTVTVTEANGCTGTLTAQVSNVENQPSINATTTPSICELANGSINITVTGGTPSYTYAWSNGETTEDLSNLDYGSYTVTVTGADGCTASSTVNLTNNNPPITVNANIADNTTCIGGNGSISTSLNPAIPPGGGAYTYTWSNGETTPYLNDLPPGSYTVTVDAGGACTQTATFIVPDNPKTPSLTYTTTPSTCELSNGSINISVSGGLTPYAFEWSNGETTEDLSNVLAGNYSVTVTGANGCTATVSVSLQNNNPPITVNANIIANTTCTGGNGSINVSVLPAVPPGGGAYTYTWSNGGTTPNLSNLSPGSYTVTVDGGGACTQTATFTIPNQPNTPSLSSSVMPATCGQSNGSINLSASGGVPPYTFNWSNGSNSQNLSNIPGGAYQVTVTGANGCTATIAVNVPDNPITFTITPTITANTSCNSSTNGSISISVAPPGNYTYTWSTGASGTVLTGLAPGGYSLTVSAGGNCTQTVSFNVPNQPNAPSLSSNITPATCGQSNGSATVLTSGGVGPFSYNWANGSNSQTLSNLLGGSYAVTVTGFNGCTAATVVTVPDENIPIAITSDITPNTSCATPNGGINISVEPANATVIWSNGATGTTLTNLAPGSYSVTVSAGGTCMETLNFNVSDDSEEPNLSTFATPSSCNLPNGAIDLSISGGLQPYLISWSNGSTLQNLSDIPAGMYSVIVTSSTGCISVATTTVPNNDPVITISGLTLPNTSCSFANGGISVTVTPPLNYIYQWSNGQTGDFIDNLTAGIYSVIVDGGGTCIQSASFEVSEFFSLPNLNSTATAATCGQDNGSVNLSVSEGTWPFAFLWSNGATTEDLTDVAPGTYSVTVTDGSGCTATTSATVGNNTVPLNISGNTTPNTSCVSANGAVNITVSPPGSYSFIWSNNTATEDLSDLTAGTYTVTVSAGGNCTATASYTVANQTQDPVISENITAAICGESNGGILLTLGGALPFSVLWSNGATTEEISNVAPGSYSVTVTDANGCSATATYNVPNNSSNFSLSGVVQHVNTCVYANGAIDLAITPPGSYGISWSNGATTEDLDSLQAGTYTVVVTESGSCTASASFTINNTTTTPVASFAVTAAFCGQSDGAIDLTASGGTTPYEFSWSNGATTEDLNGIPGGAYSVVVTAANGCSTTASTNVPDNSISFSVSGVTTPNTTCDVNNGSVDLSILPAGTYTFLWSNGETTEDLTGLSAGSYTVTVSAGGTCISEATFNVSSTTADPVVSQTITPAVCGESNGGINLTVSGGVAPYSFLWSNNETTEDLFNIAPGNYSVEVKGANGCDLSLNFIVPNNDIVFSVNGTPTANTACTQPNGNINLSITPTGTYSYLWSNGETTKDLSGIVAGSYEVTVSAGGSCTSIHSYTVQNNPDVPILTQVVTASICGAPDGSIDLSVAGGQPPFQFDWSNGATTEDLTGIYSGNYSVVVTAANGCTATGSYNVPDNSNTFSFTGTTSTNALCVGGNGAISLTVTPPGSYLFIWSNGETTQDLSGLPAGTYSVTVSDGGSCTASADFTVGDNLPVVILSGTATDALCFGENSGTIDLTVDGGFAPYTYDWFPAIPGNPEDPLDLAAGDYNVTVTDASGCTSTAHFAVGQPASAVQLVCTQSSTVSLPGLTDGEGSVNISGGTAPYSVAWTPGSSQGNVPGGVFTINNLGEGPYSVVVTDARGCTTICGFTITTDECVTAIGSMQAGQLSACASDCITALYNAAGQYLDQDDVLQFILHQGTSNQVINEIARSDQPVFCFDAALMDYGTTYYISAAVGNDDGTGNVLLTEACTQVTVGTPIVFYEIPLAGTNQPDPITCIDAEVALTGSSTVPGSTFSWHTQNGSIAGDPTQATILAGAGGLYTLVVSANGCADTLSVQVSDLQTQVNVSLSSSPSEILDCMVSQVLLAASVSGAANPAYLWQLNGAPVGAGNNLVATVSGTYEVIVTDELSGCTGGASVFIEDDSSFPPVFINAAPTLNCRDTVVTLSGGSSASGIQFLWATVSGVDTTLIGQGESTPVSAPGTYYLIGVAPNGCENATSVEVSADIATPIANAGQDQLLDCIQTPVSLNGSSTSNVAFLWTANDPSIVILNPTSPGITVNQAGVYTLTVTHLGNYCTDSDDVQVFQYENIPQGELTLQPPSCYGEKDGFISIETDPDKGPYQYQLNDKNYGSNSVFASLATGYYQVKVTDGQGCVWTTEVFLSEPEQLKVSLGADLIIKLGEMATLQAVPSVPLGTLDTILWAPEALFPCPEMPCDKQEFFPTAETRVGVTIVDENGCEASDLLALFIKKERKVYVPNSFSPNGDGVNDVFMIFAGRDVVQIKSFLVFDRWGETVFRYYEFPPNDPAYGWDGTHRGKTMNPGVFAWFAVVEFIDGEEELFEGDLMLMK